MTAATLIRQAGAAGVELRLVDGRVKARGSPQALAVVVPQLREHRAELAEFLAAAHATTDELIAAAMRTCDYHGDGPAAREQMRRDCLNTPMCLRQDLLDHFLSEQARRASGIPP
jgi:hypothetical protein